MSKTIFITGAASGIGRAVAVLFARRGWFVGLYDRDEPGLASLRLELGPAQLSSAALDVTDLEAYRARVADFEREAGGRMDVLFNCAGVLELGRFADISPEKASRMVDINVKGVLHGVYAALPLLERTPGATIVTMSSASAAYGVPEHAVYSATKFFVRGLTEALDIELEARGVRVLDIMPGYVATPMVSSQTYQAGTLRSLGVKLSAEQVADTIWKAIAARRGLTPHVIPQADVRLLSRLGGLLPELGRAALKHLGGQ